MKPYLVNYDLNKPGQNYDSLLRRLEQMGAVRVLYSQWALLSTLSAVDLRDQLKSYIDANDRILVVEIPGAWASYNLIATEKFKQIVAA